MGRIFWIIFQNKPPTPPVAYIVGTLPILHSEKRRGRTGYASVGRNEDDGTLLLAAHSATTAGASGGLKNLKFIS